MPKNNLQLFENQPIRTAWDEQAEEWLFSILDVVKILTDQSDYEKVRNYWKWLKNKLKEEGSELVSNTNQLKLRAQDGKMRLTDVANTEGIFRLIQSIPSPKAEPFKMWLAKVGKERIDETIDPELAMDRAIETYQKKGYSKEWIQQRLLSIKVRNNLTDEWRERGVKKGNEYAILTDEISKAWSGMTTREYKNYKGLKKENLRDNMSDLELVLTMLSEATTTEISKVEKPKGLAANQNVARRGGTVAGNARKEIESQTGKKVITSKNASQLGDIVTQMIECAER